MTRKEDFRVHRVTAQRTAQAVKRLRLLQLRALVAVRNGRDCKMPQIQARARSRLKNGRG